MPTFLTESPMIYAPVLVAMNNLTVMEVPGLAAHIGDSMLNDCR